MCEPEPREKLVQVGAVLVLFGLAQHDEPAAGGDERLDGVDLGARQNGRAADRALPARVGGVGDDEHVGAGQRGRGERPGGDRRDLEVTLGERRRGRARTTSPAGCSGWMAAATSGRMLQASPWDSSNSTRATLRWRSVDSMASLLPAGRRRPTAIGRQLPTP